MNQEEKIDHDRRAFLRGRWSNKTGIDETCLNNSGIYCQSCRDSCNEDAIIFARGMMGISLPTINTDLCTRCGDCVPVCPANSITISEAGRQSDE